MSPYGLNLVTCLALAAATVLVVDGHAEPTTHVRRKSQPVPTSRAAPDVTATVATPKPAAPAPDDETLPKPFELPIAPRTRIRACGEKWRSIKMAGVAGNDTWREFATKCLAQTDEPKKRTP